MGRFYYASSKRPEPSNDRLIHVLTTPEGTVVLAMRPPEQGERGYSIGVDFTVMQAVREMLGDWRPSDEGPGWVATPEIMHNRQHVGDDQTYDVTILAASEVTAEVRDYLAMARANEIVEEQNREREYAITKSISELGKLAAMDCRTFVEAMPTWPDVCETWEDDEDFALARKILGDQRARDVYFTKYDDTLRNLQAAVQ